jgi:serine/threonine protein kinase
MNNPLTHSELLEQWLDQLLDLPEAEREPFIQNRVTSPDMQQALFAILRQLSTKGILDQNPPIDLVEQSNSPSPFHLPRLSPGQALGHYFVKQLIGEGGMAQVWLATRGNDVIDHQVAIKTLKAGFGSPEIRARFLQEQQILAKLQHPFIARMYDAGVTENGTPYIVMELVKDGQSLLRHCNENCLNFKQRIALFQKIIEAVSYAHQNLVVHRDLKPSNILIDATGNPKLLDFGIAKLLHHSTDPITQTDFRMLTPEYAAPEQRSGRTITTATDVYALGVILYELLTGLRPTTSDAPQSEKKTALSSPSEAIRKLQLTEHTESSDIKLNALSAQRATNIDQLWRSLKGDLDIIIMKSLQEDPERRYRSVTALSDDLHRYITQQPITARKDTWLYLSHKFIRRHVYGVITSLVTFGLLLCSTSYSFYQANIAQTQAQQAHLQAERAQTEKLRATQQTKNAQLQAERATEIKRFLTDLLQASSSGIPYDKVPSTETLLQEGATRVSREFEHNPELKLELLLLLEDIHRQLGLTKTSKQLLEQAKTLAQEKFSPKDDLWLTTQCHVATWLHADSKLQQAVQGLENSIAQYQNQNRTQSLTLAKSFSLLGRYYDYLYQYDKAITATEKSIRIFRLNGYDDSDLTSANIVLANILANQGRAIEAIAVSKQTLFTIEKKRGKEHLAYADALSTLHAALTMNGQYAETELPTREQIRILKAIYQRPVDKIAAAYFHLGQTLQLTGKYDEAAHWAEQSIKTYSQLDENHAGLVGPLLLLGRILAAQQQFKNAASVTQKALDLSLKVYGANHPYSIAAWGDLGNIMLEQKNYADALRYLSLAVKQQTQPDIYGLFTRITQIETELALKLPQQALIHSEENLGYIQSKIKESNLFFRALRSTIELKAKAYNQLKRYHEVTVMLPVFIMEQENLPSSLRSDLDTEANLAGHYYELGVAQFHIHANQAAVKSFEKAWSLTTNRVKTEFKNDIQRYLTKAKAQLNIRPQS